MCFVKKVNFVKIPMHVQSMRLIFTDYAFHKNLGTTNWIKHESQVPSMLQAQCTRLFWISKQWISYLIQAQPEKSFTTIITILKSMRGSLKNWQACMSPIICPFSVFLLPLWSSNKVHPLGARNRSSFRIANAFANSRRPSIKVQKPIFWNHKRTSTIHFPGEQLWWMHK